MRTDIAKALAFQLTQEDQAPTDFYDIQVVENYGPSDSIVRATYHNAGQPVGIEINALEDE